MAVVFNKEALEALDEHSEAEEMARVASPKVRVVLGAMVAMMAVVVYWCIFGTINYKVTTQGIVFPFGEAIPVSTPQDGIISRCLVSNGTAVVPGTPIVELRHTPDTAVVTATCNGVVISTLPLGTELKVGEPTAWLLNQSRQNANREMLCYVTYDDLTRLKTGQQVQATPANMEREDWGYAYGRVVGIEHLPTNRQEIVRRLKLEPLAAFIPDGQAMYEVRVVLDQQNGSLIWSRKKSQGVEIVNGTRCNIQIVTQKKPVWRVLIGAVENTAESVEGM